MAKNNKIDLSTALLTGALIITLTGQNFAFAAELQSESVRAQQEALANALKQLETNARLDQSMASFEIPPSVLHSIATQDMGDSGSLEKTLSKRRQEAHDSYVTAAKAKGEQAWKEIPNPKDMNKAWEVTGEKDPNLESYKQSLRDRGLDPEKYVRVNPKSNRVEFELNGLEAQYQPPTWIAKDSLQTVVRDHYMSDIARELKKPDYIGFEEILRQPTEKHSAGDRAQLAKFQDLLLKTAEKEHSIWLAANRYRANPKANFQQLPWNEMALSYGGKPTKFDASGKVEDLGGFPRAIKEMHNDLNQVLSNLKEKTGLDLVQRHRDYLAGKSKDPLFADLEKQFRFQVYELALHEGRPLIELSEAHQAEFTAFEKSYKLAKVSRPPGKAHTEAAANITEK